jgi:DNA-binding transcriptional MerR regulator
MSVSERHYLSIGEVLGLLLEEFPDVTISKIRFLESQGLIDPERTQSGYRKFYDGDVERLRVILREQRENFLPLRVIKDRLENGGIDESGALTPPRGIRNVPTATVGTDETGELQLPEGTPVPTAHHPAAKVRSIVPTAAEALAPPAAPSQPAAPPAEAPGVRNAPPPTLDLTDGSSNPAAAFFARTAGGNEPNLVVFDSTPDEYTVNEICAHAGITNKQLVDLESFGLVSPKGTGTTAIYSQGDLAVLRLCANFLERGVEPRHLRAWRQAVDREAALFEQLVTPLIRQRNPQSRQQAGQTLGELSRLGAELRSELLRAALKHHLDN